jgi:hypothetical protein
MGTPVDITTDAAGFAIIALDYGQVVAQIHFSSTVASTAFDLLIEDQHNRGNTSANFTQWRDSNGTLKFDNVPITSLDPVVFSPQEMAPIEGIRIAIQLGTAEARTLRVVPRNYV